MYVPINDKLAVYKSGEYKPCITELLRCTHIHNLHTKVYIKNMQPKFQHVLHLLPIYSDTEIHFHLLNVYNMRGGMIFKGGGRFWKSKNGASAPIKS